MGGRSQGPTTATARRREAARAQLSVRRPYRLITSDDPCKTLGQGEVRHYARIIDAANAHARK
jgi:hypothetical protein